MPPMPPTMVKVDAVQVVPSQPTYTALAVWRRQQTQLAAEESGRLLRAPMRAGQRVSAGAELAAIDTSRIDTEIAEQNALLAELEARAVERQAELNKLSPTSLWPNKSKALCPSKTCVRSTTARTAQARIRTFDHLRDAINARIALLELRKVDATLRAPYDAWVVHKHREQGAWVSPGTPIYDLVGTGVVEAHLDVPERFLGAVRAHAETVSIDVAGVSYTSRAVRVIPQVDPQVRTFRLVAEFDDENSQLVPGQSLAATIAIGPLIPTQTVDKNAIAGRGLQSMVLAALGPRLMALA